MPAEWTVDTLHDHFAAILAERDRRYDQRFAAQESVLARTDMATNRRFESVNEFRQTLSDQASGFVARVEYQSGHTHLTERIADIASRVTAIESYGVGAKSVTTDRRSLTSVLLQQAAVVVAFLAILASVTVAVFK